MEEEAAAAAAGGWVIPAALDVRDEAFAVPPEQALYEDNIALRNVFLSMALTVNKVWGRRGRERTVNNLRSFRRETNAIRRDISALRASAQHFTELVQEAGGAVYAMPVGLNDAVVELELAAVGG